MIHTGYNAGGYIKGTSICWSIPLQQNNYNLTPCWEYIETNNPAGVNPGRERKSRAIFTTFCTNKRMDVPPGLGRLGIIFKFRLVCGHCVVL